MPTAGASWIQDCGAVAASFSLSSSTYSSTSLASNTVQELYRLTGEVLGQGVYAIVQTCVNIYTEAQPGQGLQGDQPLPPRPGPQ